MKYKQIELTRGKYALVDDEDFDYLNQFKWHYTKIGYGARNTQKDNKRVVIYLHSFINKTPKGFDTDHINRNKLDNRKCNLRTVSRSENMANRVNPRIDNHSTGYLNIYYVKRYRKFVVSITRNKKCVFNRYFKTFKEAKIARNKFIKTL